MNLALRDMRHNVPRFALTAIGLGMLLGVVISMMGIYEGALDDALRLPRAASPDLWVVQPRTRGPFAEAVAHPARHARPGAPHPRRRDRRRRDVPDGANGRARQAAAAASCKAIEIGRPGGPIDIASGHGLTESHYQIVADASSGLRLGEQVPLGPYRDAYTVVGLTQRDGHFGRRSGRLGHVARRAVAAVRGAAGAAAAREPPRAAAADHRGHQRRAGVAAPRRLRSCRSRRRSSAGSTCPR